MTGGETMAVPGEEDEQRLAFRSALEDAPLTLEQIWIKYFSFGGKAGLTEVQAYVHGALIFPVVERDLLAHALNESLNALGVNGRRATYSRDIYPRTDESESGAN